MRPPVKVYATWLASQTNILFSGYKESPHARRFHRRKSQRTLPLRGVAGACQGLAEPSRRRGGQPPGAGFSRRGPAACPPRQSAGTGAGRADRPRRRPAGRHPGVQGLVFRRAEGPARPVARARPGAQGGAAVRHRRQQRAHAGRGLRIEAGTGRAQGPGGAARRIRRGQADRLRHRERPGAPGAGPRAAPGKRPGNLPPGPLATSRSRSTRSCSTSAW